MAIEFVKRMRKVQKEVRVVLRKVQEEIKKQADRGRWKSGRKRTK